MMLAFTSMLAIAPLCSAAEAEVKVHTDAPDVSVRTDADRDRAVVGTRVEDAAAIRAQGIKKPNKASGLIGMEVHNYQNEKLGEIKDLVLDFNSGKVSYAVLAVGGFLGIGEKLIAIPPSAFTVSDDQNFLKLNADKAKIEAAPGFAATNWPRIGDPGITHHRYWSGEASTGAPGAYQSDRSTRIYTDARDAKVRGEVRAHTDNDYKTIHGKVRTVDLKNNKIVIDTDAGVKKVFNIDDQTTFTSGRAKGLRLDEFRPGYDVTVRYDENEGRLNAYSIENTNP